MLRRTSGSGQLRSIPAASLVEGSVCKLLWGGLLIFLLELLLWGRFVTMSDLGFCLIHRSCPILWDLLDYSPPGSSVHGTFQARILERVAISSSRGSSQPRDQTCIFHVSCTEGRFFTHIAIGGALILDCRALFLKAAWGMFLVVRWVRIQGALSNP